MKGIKVKEIKVKEIKVKERRQVNEGISEINRDNR